MKNIIILKINKKNGFTLVEALVAISILMIAIASPMTLAQKSLSTATLSKDQMIGAFLAQDGIEAVRNIRDQIAVTNTSGDWLNNTLLNNCICATDVDCNLDDTVNRKYCAIDTTSARWTAVDIQPAIENPGPLRISFDSSSKFLKYDYSPTATDNSKFTRYINIRKTSDTDTDGKNEAIVKVRVVWDSPQGIQKIEVSDFIYNYSENL